MTAFETWLQSAGQLMHQPLLNLGTIKLTVGKLVVLAGVLLAAHAFSKAIDRGLRRFTLPGRRLVLNESSLYALSRILRYTVWIIAVLTALNVVGMNLSQLALIGGAIGVGVGFGLQNLVSNFVSGIVLLLEQTLKVGDFVDLQSGVVGRVSEINIRYTRVTTNDSVDIIVPNSEFINGRVTNWTFNERSRRIHIPFGVAYGTDKDKVRAAGLAAAAVVEGTILDEAHQPDVWLVGFGDSSLNFELIVWVDHGLVITPGRTQHHYLWALETELKRQGIEIPFPQRDLHIRSGTLPVRNVPAE